MLSQWRLEGRPASRFAIDRRYLPVTMTIGLFLLSYIAAGLRYDGIFSTQVFFNLLIDNAFLLISAVGMTFVILSGGIDLSVASVIAFTAMASAALVERAGVSPLIAIPLVLLFGSGLGAGMGALIQFWKIPPFVATLAGMFLARGSCFLIGVDAIPINHPFYKEVAQFQIQPFGGAFISINVVVALVALLVGVYLLHYTPFGRVVYALGGSEQSSLLMGLPVARTKVLVYTLNGFCSALAGVVYSVYMLSGHGLYANGFELDIISAVVIGGTPLSGGIGYVVGTFFGVLIQGLIQVVITFDGTLNSWWTRIVVGLLTLFFIVMQRFLTGQGQKPAHSS
ncbi:MAG TPA: galactofuranose ABC transporter, permease protein YjfF [Roseiflexaceae bacterium]|nr:galactofuranose ABC transporter, permease protein YjfF [Roseiflexaceae bacterium]